MIGGVTSASEAVASGEAQRGTFVNVQFFVRFERRRVAGAEPRGDDREGSSVTEQW
jgi:hypothetical protein